MTDLYGVLLYGAPGTGKDATTAALTALDPRVRHCRRIKIGTGRQHTYRTVTPEQLDEMRLTPGAILYENQQYGGVYVADRAELERMEAADLTPVLHLGQPEGVRALRAAGTVTQWVAVELACDRDIAVTRIEQRSTGDTERRLAVLDTTPHLPDADLTLDTGKLSADECAARILAAITPANHEDPRS